MFKRWIALSTDNKSKIFAHMEVAGALVKMQVDSGGSCNVLSRKLLPKDPVIDRADVKLTPGLRIRAEDGTDHCEAGEHSQCYRSGG